MGYFFHHISILLNSFLFSFSMAKKGGDDSRMGNVGNAKMQRDEVLKQVEGNIYMDYLTQNMRNKWRMLAYNSIYFPLTGVFWDENWRGRIS